jgi:DNA modification methylase
MSQPWPADEVERRPIESLVPYARNARTHSPAQVAQIAASMREFGWTNPVLVDEDGTLIAGHGRVLAARQLELTEIPVMVARGWTEAQRRAYVLADNKLALNAGWDTDLLKVELSALDALGFDTALTGFSEDEFATLFASEEGAGGNTDPDDVPDATEPVSEPGDLWILGPHRLICGDSTSLEAVEALMAGELADGCWTDPPYNVNYESKLAGKIKNDSMADDKFRDFLRDAFVSAWAVMKEGAAIYVAHADTEGFNFRGAFREAGFKLSGCLVWAKDSLVLGRSDYQWQHEPILYGWKTGARHRWYGGRKHTTLMQLGGSVFSANEDGTITARIGGESIVISGDNLVATAVESTVIRCEKPKRSAEHPTMKPVDLISKMLRNSTREGDVVLDLFGGSGSTLISCEMLGRQARLVELDPRFVDVIVKRWQAFTGQTAVLEADGRSFQQVEAQRFPAAA